MNADKACTASFTPNTIATPLNAPYVTNVDHATNPTIMRTWNWTPNGSTCPSGSIMRYHYKLNYTGYDPAYTSAVTATTAEYTAQIEGRAYTVYVQSQCYNATTGGVSGWSTAGSSTYTRPIPQCTLTLIASPATGSGTVSKSPDTATYNCGTSIRAIPTITATPNTNYSAVWSGDTGCSGVASHTIVMDADKTCTATFTANTYYTLRYTAGTGGSISGTTPQTVLSGSSGMAVTAVPSLYYSFVNWSDGSTSATRRETNVRSDLDLIANFYSCWIPGKSGTVLSGKFVYCKDAGSPSLYTWYDRNIGCVSRGAAIGRSPTLIELRAMYIDRLTYEITSINYYWASGSIIGSDEQVVHFYNGHEYWRDKDIPYAVRCVVG